MAKTYGISFKQVINWVHRFKESGIQDLYDMPGRGRKSILSMVNLEKIRELVLYEAAENLGYNSKRWSGPLLLKLKNKTYDTKYQIAQVYKLLNRIGVEFRKEKGYIADK